MTEALLTYVRQSLAKGVPSKTLLSGLVKAGWKEKLVLDAIEHAGAEVPGVSLLSIEGVSKSFGSQLVLSNLQMSVRKGEIFGIIGPSGAGKTTLLNLIGGLDKPTAGLIYLNGKDIGSLSKHQLTKLRLYEIGFIFQDYNLIPVLTAQENVEFVMLLQKIHAKERARRALVILEEVGLGGLAHRRPAELSGGQQQRVAVARAIVSEPQLVLADEPTANLDSETGASIIELLRSLNERKGITFIFSTHDPMVMERAQRVIRLKDGQIIGVYLQNGHE